MEASAVPQAIPKSPPYWDVLDTLFRPSKRFIWQLCTESLVQFDIFVRHSRSKSNNLIYSNVLYFLENLWIYFRQLTVWILFSECLKQIPVCVQSEPFSRKLFSLLDWTQRHKLIHSSKIMKNASKHRNVFWNFKLWARGKVECVFPMFIWSGRYSVVQVLETPVYKVIFVTRKIYVFFIIKSC